MKNILNLNQKKKLKITIALKKKSVFGKIIINGSAPSYDL